MPARPIPQATAETEPFWQGARSGEVRLPKCLECGRLHHPPLARCPYCLAQKLEWITLSGRCRLRSWTTIHVASVPGVESPFTICEAELAEQNDLVLIGHLAGISDNELAVGREMKIGFTAGANGTAYPQIEPLPADASTS
jgi:uncharacterized OB-fold protein